MRGAGTVLLWAVVLAAAVAVPSGVPATAALRVEPVASLEEGLAAPTAVVAGDEFLAVLEPFQDRLVVFTPEGRLITRVDLSGDTAGLVRLSSGEYVVCDRTAGSIIFVDPKTSGLRRAAFAGALAEPFDLVQTGDALGVLDARAAELVTLEMDGRVRARRALVDGNGKPLAYPTGLAVFGDEFFVLDQPTSRVHVYDAAGAHLREFCSFGSGQAEVSRGGGLRIDDRGLLYIADRYQGRVAVFDVTGAFHGHLDPSVLDGDRLDLPMGMAVDGDGILYVASAEASRVDLFLVSLEGDPTGLPTATALSPVGEDVAPDDPWFSIEAVFASRPLVPVSVDFRLWAAADPSDPIAEVQAATVDEGEPVAGAFTVRASWRPELELAEGTEYLWSARLHAGPLTGVWSEPWRFTTATTPRVFRLAQNRPNPFRTATTLVFSLPEPGDARLVVFDLQGREVWRAERPGLTAGVHEAVWQGDDAHGRPMPPGIYFCRLTAGGRVDTRKMVLARGGR